MVQASGILTYAEDESIVLASGQGTFMALTWASKVNSILTVVAVGIAVIIDLWDILDIKKGHSMVSSIVQHLVCTLFLNASAGILLAALCGSRSCLYRSPAVPLSVRLLDPPLPFDQLWYWRHLHEPCIPGDSERQ